MLTIYHDGMKCVKITNDYYNPYNLKLKYVLFRWTVIDTASRLPHKRLLAIKARRLWNITGDSLEWIITFSEDR